MKHIYSIQFKSEVIKEALHTLLCYLFTSTLGNALFFCFNIQNHLCQKLIRANSNSGRKAKLIKNSLLNLTCHFKQAIAGLDTEFLLHEWRGGQYDISTSFLISDNHEIAIQFLMEEKITLISFEILM